MSLYYSYEDIMNFMECGRSKAYEIIRMLNEELKAKNKLTFRGKINKKYFHEKFDMDTQKGA